MQLGKMRKTNLTQRSVVLSTVTAMTARDPNCQDRHGNCWEQWGRMTKEVDVREPSTEVLLRVIGNQRLSLQVRREAVHDLSRRRVSCHSIEFQRQWRDGNASARCMLVQIAGMTSTPRSARFLEAVLSNLSEPIRVRIRAAAMLTCCGRSFNCPTLRKFCSDPSPSIRIFCAVAIGNICREDSIPTLGRLLNDHSFVRDVGRVSGIAKRNIEALSYAASVRNGGKGKPESISSCDSHLCKQEFK